MKDTDLLTKMEIQIEENTDSLYKKIMHLKFIDDRKKKFVSRHKKAMSSEEQYELGTQIVPVWMRNIGKKQIGN